MFSYEADDRIHLETDKLTDFFFSFFTAGILNSNELSDAVGEAL